ncbi:hypothetical protein LINPERHAP2_LOCUS37028 [Linum perenne]
MPLFAFKSNNHFVTSSDGAILQVHELTKSSDHLSSIHKSDWKKIATISPGLDDDDDDIDSKATDDMSYNGLLFFDGHGRIKGRIALTMLAQHLKQLHLLVSPEGYCFQEVSEIGTYPDFGIHYLRLNDLFSWPRHEVDLVTINVWSRLELTYSLPKYKNTTSTTIIGGRVNKEKYAELEKLVKEKDKELEKLKEEMDEVIEENEAKEEELQKLKKTDEEHQKQLKKKDKKKDEEDEEKAQRIEELEKLNEDLAEENKAKDEELQMLEKVKNMVEMRRQLKKKDDELRLLKKKKDAEERIEELEKLNEDLEEANKAKEEELQKLAKSKNTGELQRQLKKKDDELKILKKKKDEEEAKAQRIEELEKLNEELEEANKAKDEELQKIKKKKPSEEGNKATKIAQLEKLKEQMEDTIATKDEELEKIKKEKDEEIRKMLKKKEAELRALKDKKNDDEEKSRRIEELEKEKEEMEVANVARDEELQKLRKGRNDELQKLLREKNHEIRVLEKKKEDEKNDEEAKARKAEGELEEVKDQLSFSVARVAHVNKELEQCQKLSWAILPSTKFVPQSADAREMHLTRRQRCPPEKLSCNPQLSFPHVFNSPKLVDKMYIWSSNNVKLVDEENSTAWPPPPTIDMRVGAGVQDFDKNDWWYVKTTHPEGGLTMLVYYDGKRSQISLYNNSVPLPLPFTKGAVEFTTHTYNFSFFDLPPLGMRLGFTYRP